MLNTIDIADRAALQSTDIASEDIASEDIASEDIVSESLLDETNAAASEEAEIEATENEQSLGEFSPEVPLEDESVATELPWDPQDIAQVERVSVDSEGAEGLGFAAAASLSADGRFVAFSSDADSLAPEDTNLVSDVFVRDRLTGLTELISASANAEAAPSYNPVISSDGQLVAFESQLEDVSSVFVYDRSTQTTEQIAVNEAGEAANADARGADMSAAGRYVVFESAADNLNPGNFSADDENALSHIFVRDRLLDTLQMITLAADGSQSNGASSQASISADGQYVAFTSTASNLVENDTNETADIFLYDRDTQTTERISVTDSGEESNGFSRAPSISADGRYVSYDSLATNLVSDDTNLKGDVFVYDRLTQTTSRISVSSDGEQSNNFSFNHDISADGRYISYSSVATNLVENDTNRVRDIFVFDQVLQTTTRLSVSAEGIQGNRESRESVFSANGRFVAFQSSADVLVEDDTNGRTDIFVYDFNSEGTDVPIETEDAVVIDELTGLEAPTVTASIEVTRSAGYDNTVGWYVVEDKQGSVKDALTGEVLSPEDDGYMQAALSQRLEVSLTGINNEVVSYEADVATGSLLSTFIVSNGSIESLLDADMLNDPDIFFGHLGANSDGEKHVQKLSDNTYGYEDLLGGGDRDFNDMIVKMTFA